MKIALARTVAPTTPVDRDEQRERSQPGSQGFTTIIQRATKRRLRETLVLFGNSCWLDNFGEFVGRLVSGGATVRSPFSRRTARTIAATLRRNVGSYVYDRVTVDGKVVGSG
jgi:hypothetical protein